MAQDSDTVEEARTAFKARATAIEDVQIQPAGFLVELSLDWIVVRASENVDDFLGESHVTLIEEPFSRFVQAQALHDLRNLFSRLSGSTGIARAYRVRLTDDRPRLDIAFQVRDNRVLIEGTASPERGFGQALGSVGGLVEGLAGIAGKALLDGAARRVRALTGFDSASILCGDRSAQSSRGSFGPAADSIADLPAIVADIAAAPIPVFPRKPADSAIRHALLRSPPAETLQKLREQGIGSAMSVPLSFEGERLGAVECHSRAARTPNFELHAATELFGQLLALRLEVDRLRAN